MGVIRYRFSRLQIGDGLEAEALLQSAWDARERVGLEASAAFRKEALGQEWLWTEAMIADWESAKSALDQAEKERE